jgi:hypothetical protein
VGLKIVDEEKPLDCPELDEGATEEESEDGRQDVVWYYFRPHTAFNIFHIHNDNLLPLYR